MPFRKKRKRFCIAGAFDTETTNIIKRDCNGSLESADAFPVLYIFNPLLYTDLHTYAPGDTQIEYYRYASDFTLRLQEIMSDASVANVIPVIVAYNLMFDMQSVIYRLNELYDMKITAQSSTHVYTLDLLDDDGNICLRFWDAYFLDMRGLEAMGQVCGVEKATGSWDYSLVRTPETQLIDKERHYAARDVEVIPAYLRYLLESNEWLEPCMLGCEVLTKTSLVRQMAKREIGTLRYKGKGAAKSVQVMMQKLCEQEAAQTYDQYALRKACFRGGFTFTSATYAGEVQRHVYSLDETSAHHAFINGHMLPVKFQKVPNHVIDRWCTHIVETSMEKLLTRWDEPFSCAIHACMRFENIRLREGSCFDVWKIALLAESKFYGRASDSFSSEQGMAADDGIRGRGWKDRANNARFAFGKLYSAEVAVVHVTELELWAMAQVYEWDSMRCLDGELSISFVRPPDFVTLQSNVLFRRKQDMKHITKLYKEGVPYREDIPASIPSGIAARLRNGFMTDQDVQGYYGSTVKGMFNGIYGTQAQDVHRPDYQVEHGSVELDHESVITPGTFDESYRENRSKLVCYTYGMRIVGGSRAQLVLAIMLLWKRFGGTIRILGGDTDSMKIATPEDVSGDDLIEALEPLHVSITNAIDRCMERVRRAYPDLASDLKGVGCFEVEGDAYPLHMDAWNKARVSWDGEHAHITCAGLSRPKGRYHIENWIDDMVYARGVPFERIAPIVLGYNVTVTNAVCHYLERTHPLPSARYQGYVTDYLDNEEYVDVPAAIALYDGDRILGESSKKTNARTILYLEMLGRPPDLRNVIIDYDGKRPICLIEDTERGWIEYDGLGESL